MNELAKSLRRGVAAAEPNALLSEDSSASCTLERARQSCDSITILTALHPLVMAKTWQTDGSIKPYDNARNFSLRTASVCDIYQLHDLLMDLATERQSCLIRGGHIGNDLAEPLMASDANWHKGCVLRQERVFKDRALHALLIDVDKFRPTCHWSNDDPVAALEEFIRRHLPACFHGITFHWQLSSSAGQEKYAGVLKAHLWFWLDVPRTGGQLNAWKVAAGLSEVDVAVFRTVQPLYTANPIMSAGVVDPVAVRSGLIDGLTGDSVELDLSETVLIAAAKTPQADHNEVLRAAVSNDPVAQRLYEKVMVKAEAGKGGLYVVCPREQFHTNGNTNQTACLYLPAHTGGYSFGNWKCLHASCEGQPRHLFETALGLSAADGFEDAGVTADLDRSLQVDYEDLVDRTDTGNANLLRD